MADTTTLAKQIAELLTDCDHGEALAVLSTVLHDRAYAIQDWAECRDDEKAEKLDDIARDLFECCDEIYAAAQVLS